MHVEEPVTLVFAILFTLNWLKFILLQISRMQVNELFWSDVQGRHQLLNI